jgi:copper transport protein
VGHGVRRHRATAWVVACLTAAVTVLCALPARAHAIVKTTEPGIDEVVARAPERILMEFNEPVEISFGSIRVFDSHGGRVEDGEAAYVPGTADAVQVPLLPDLADGTYTVAWRIVSADGHPIGEAYVFHVGAPGSNPRGVVDSVLAGEGRAGPLESGLAAAGRWLLFASLLLIAGAAFFLVLVWGRSLAPPPGVQSAFVTRWRRVVTAAWIGAVVATVALFVLQGSLAADVPMGDALSGDILVEVAGTRFGILSLVRLGLLIACVAIWPALRRSLEVRPSLGAVARAVRLAPWIVGAGGVLILALLATPGLGGHAGTTSPTALNVGVDVLHLVGAAAWVGGLVLLAVGAFPATRDLSDGDRATALAPVVARFSDLAVIAVAALVLSGLVRAWAEVRAFRALTDATYGITLLVKVAAFLPILALGAINNRWTKPRIVRAVAEGDPARAPLGALRRLVGIEVALGVVVLAITALLVNLPPARVEAGVSGPFTTEVPLGHHQLHVMVDPNRVGENRVHLELVGMAEEPVPLDGVRVLFRMPEEGIGPIVAEAEGSAMGAFVVHGHQLSVPGEWTLEIVARTGEFEEERTTVQVVVNP